MTHICKFCYLFVVQKMDMPIDPSVNSIAPLETQQIANDAQSNPMEEAENSPNIEEVERSPNKRGLTSAAWTHFKRKKIEGKWKVICKYCEKKLGGDTRSVRGPKQSILKTLQQSSSSVRDRVKSILSENYTFNQDAARMELTKMIALHEYPLAMINHIGFRRFSNVVQPLFKVISRNTLKLDILKFYESERAKTMKLIQKNSSRIAISTDMWTASNQNKGYMTITTHFIDNNWNLQSRLMRFIYVPAPHSVEVLAEIIIEHFFEWNLDRKVSTITVDNCSTNDAMIPKILSKFGCSSFILEGTYFHMQCCAHILNLIVKDGMSIIHDSIEKIRDIFKRLTQGEPQYKSLPSDDDWKMATEICEKLEIFYKVTELSSGTQYPTSNVYFSKMCEIRLTLNEWIFSSNSTIQGMADSMIPKFKKHWGMINGVMTIGVILDPRLKMKLLNYFFPLMKKRTTSIFTSSLIVSSLDSNGGKVDWSSDFLKYVQETSSDDCVKSELDLYLKELVLFNQSNISNFNMLGYWKNIGVKYLTLQRIAKDFLAILISTVASEPAFNLGGQFLTPHRSKLNEDIVRHLCALKIDCIMRLKVINLILLVNFSSKQLIYFNDCIIVSLGSLKSKMEFCSIIDDADTTTPTI
ncbi:putative AC transposase [Glycine soja]